MHLIYQEGKWQNTFREALGVFLDNKDIFNQQEDSLTKASVKNFKIRLV